MIFKHVDLNPEIKIKTPLKEKLKMGGGKMVIKKLKFHNQKINPRLTK